LVLVLFVVAFLLQLAGAIGVIQDVLASRANMRAFTWDEGDNGENNQIPTVFYGANVKTGAYGEPVTDYSVLFTLEQMYGLNTTGNAATVPAVTDIWVH